MRVPLEQGPHLSHANTQGWPAADSWAGVSIDLCFIDSGKTFVLTLFGAHSFWSDIHMF